MRGAIEGSRFGVELVNPVDHYRMSDRSVKYAGLFILLTFATIWLIEVLAGVRVHPIQYLMLGGALCLFGLLLGEAEHFHLTRGGALAILWLIVAGSLLGYSAYMWLLSHVPAVKVSTYAYVNPVIAVLLGWLLLDEPLDRRMAVGTCVILGGVAVVNLARVRTKT